VPAGAVVRAIHAWVAGGPARERTSHPTLSRPRSEYGRAIGRGEAIRSADIVRFRTAIGIARQSGGVPRVLRESHGELLQGEGVRGIETAPRAEEESGRAGRDGEREVLRELRGDHASAVVSFTGGEDGGEDTTPRTPSAMM